MSIQELTQHPEMLNRDTLYELRRITAEYPYYQPARLLLLKNLYLLHDATFDEELRRSAIYFTDRKILFNLVEAAHYRLKRKSPQSFNNVPDRRQVGSAENISSRTVSLIDTFLSSIPKEEDEKDGENENITKKETKHRKPTAADATVDYVAYLLATDFEELNDNDSNTDQQSLTQEPTMNGGALIDAFINNDGGRFNLQEEPEYHPEITTANEDGDSDDELLTETMAGIYIQQGRYEKALEIMNRINSTTQKKSPYFEDQQRFLKKLIQIKNSNNK
ncbi:MAG: tetratricopeptide repeat protein [Prevotella sp.]|nr:tetratricopeptide repeat protein [Prevotella sp.]